MFIPKDDMKVLISVLDAGLHTIGSVLTSREKEVIHQIADRAALCANGDAPWLEIEICYANKPDKAFKDREYTE